MTLTEIIGCLPGTPAADEFSLVLPRMVIRALCVGLLGLIAMVCIVRAQQSVAHPDFVVAKPVINMYAKPLVESEVVSQAIYGTGVQLLKQQEDWISIRSADGYEGWVEASGLKALQAGGYAAEGKLVQVAGLSVNVYRDPSVTHHAPLLQLPWEARLEAAPGAAEESERWLRVRLVDGQLGWVQRGDLRQASSPLSIDETIALAQRFMGITYTWGGVSSFGFDCSGFTQMLMRQRGILMPRDADVQAAWSGLVAVERKDLKAGDLLFFGADAAHITHTGMYIGNGEFIHDTTHDHPGVQISRVNDEPWTRILVAARRAKQ